MLRSEIPAPPQYSAIWKEGLQLAEARFRDNQPQNSVDSLRTYIFM